MAMRFVYFTFYPTNYDNDNKCAVKTNITSLLMKLVSSLKWVHINKQRVEIMVDFCWFCRRCVIRKPVVHALHNNLLVCLFFRNSPFRHKTFNIIRASSCAEQYHIPQIPIYSTKGIYSSSESRLIAQYSECFWENSSIAVRKLMKNFSRNSTVGLK